MKKRDKMIERVILKCVYFSYIEQTKIYTCVAALSFWIISFVKKNILFYKLFDSVSLRDEKKNFYIEA